MNEKEFTGATTESALAGQAPPVPLKNGFTDVGHPPPHKAVEPAEPQTGRQDESIPVTRGNHHLLIGADPGQARASGEINTPPVTGPGTDQPQGGITRTAGTPESASPDIEQVGNTVILKEDTADSSRPEFEPGKPKPRTDADADPHEVTTPGFQGLDRVNPLPIPQPLNTIEHRGAPNEPHVVGVQTAGGADAIEVVGSESDEARALRGDAPEGSAKDDDEGDSEQSGEHKRGHLPETFPGYAPLEAAGQATYARVRKLIETETLIEVPGIGQATAEKIVEEMAAN